MFVVFTSLSPFSQVNSKPARLQTQAFHSSKREFKILLLKSLPGEEHSFFFNGVKITRLENEIYKYDLAICIYTLIMWFNSIVTANPDHRKSTIKARDHLPSLSRKFDFKFTKNKVVAGYFYRN